MANAITAHTIANGPRNLILQYNIVADGSGDESNLKLLDVTDYTGADQNASDDFKVIKVSGRNGVGTSFQLLFGSAGENNRLFFESTTDDSFDESWTGGLSTLVSDTDMSVRLTTSGFDASGDTITLKIHLQKKRSGVNA